MVTLQPARGQSPRYWPAEVEVPIFDGGGGGCLLSSSYPPARWSGGRGVISGLQASFASPVGFTAGSTDATLGTFPGIQEGNGWWLEFPP